MRVCYITSGVGMGHYHYAQNFLHGLSKVGDITVDVFYIEDQDEAAFPSVRSIHPLATSMKGNRVLNVATTLGHHTRFLVYLLTKRPDVVHFNTVFRNQSHTYGLTLLAKLVGARVIRTVHEVTHDRLQDVSEREHRMATRHLRACDHLIVHSEAVEDELRAENVPTPTTVLPHGNYLFFRDYLNPDAEPPLPTNGKPVVLFFGPKQHKGIEVFADALGNIEEPFTTWIVGQVAEDAEDAVARIADGPDAYVERSYIPDEELPQYFHHVDVVVLPYISGTTSGALHLTRAFETAVISSDLPYFEQVIKDGFDGYLLKETTPEALSAALEDLLSSPEIIESLAQSGLESERSDRFNWARLARECLDAYSPA